MSTRGIVKMRNFEEFNSKIILYRSFNEGTEIGDTVELLLDAANILNGLALEHELSLTILVVEKMIRDYMENAQNQYFSWDEYQRIDPKLYAFFLGGAEKLSEKDYFSENEEDS